MKKQAALFAALLTVAAPALAEVDLTAVDACFESARATQTDPAACINAAQDTCLDNAEDTPAVTTLCYVQARDVWSDGLARVFADIIPTMDGTDAAVLQIETKYALLGNLLQCDRIEELSLAASDLTGAAIALQSARCQASATAAMYLRLYRLRLAQTD